MRTYVHGKKLNLKNIHYVKKYFVELFDVVNWDNTMSL